MCCNSLRHFAHNQLYNQTLDFLFLIFAIISNSGINMYLFKLMFLFFPEIYPGVELLDHMRNLYAGQEATVRTGHGTMDWFQIGKGVRQGCILSPWLFNLYAEYIMRNAGLGEHKLESRLTGEISITSEMQMTHPYGRK